MILKALTQYYARNAGEENDALPPPGFEHKVIPVIVEIDRQGELVQVHANDREATVPHRVKRATNVAANLLWDNADYVLGLAVKGKPARVARQHAAFIERVRLLGDPAGSDDGIRALLSFLENFDAASLEQTPHWQRLQSNPNISFQLQHDNCLICERPNVMATLRDHWGKKAPGAVCLVTGNAEKPERLHPLIKGVWGAQSAGANIVSFNRNSSASYGKSQGLNAPVGKQAVFAYTTALNHLLRKGSGQRFQVGDTTAVCWSAERHAFEADFATMWGATPASVKEDQDNYTGAVKAVFDAVRHGALADRGDTPFYLLGLAPNASRIAIRFWLTGTVSEFAVRTKAHFDYLEMVRADYQPAYPPLSLLLINTAFREQPKHILPSLGGDTLRTILADLPYPYTLFAATIRRCRAAQRVNYARAAMIKAYLNKRFGTEVLKVALDKDNTDPAYRSGRLFATLQKLQEEAYPDINATINERFYAAASGNPARIFPALLTRSNHHLTKLYNQGRRVNFEKLLGEMMAHMPGALPAAMSLEEQGRFAVGYYHQRQDFFTKRGTSEPGDAL